MAQEIEIEFKNILTYDEFLRLIHDFQVKKEDFKEQTNFYCDTIDFRLKDLQSALRVRFKGDTYTLTLKQQKKEHVLETHQTITKHEFSEVKSGRSLPTGEVTDQLRILGIDVEGIRYLGSLTTLRLELPFKDGLLVLDENHYLGKIDYELEYESTDYKKGHSIFLELLEHKSIPRRDTETKIHRFFREKEQQSV